MSDSPAAILYDELGNPVSVVLDGGVYKLQLLSKLQAGTEIIGQVGIDPAQKGGLAEQATLASLEGKDFATETTQATLATEATLAGQAADVASLEGKDFATETTQATLATEATLAGQAADIASLEGKDFATNAVLGSRAAESTLQSTNALLTTIDAVLDSVKDTDGVKKITDPLPAGTNILGKIGIDAAEKGGLAEQATLAALEAKDFATQTTLATRASEATLQAQALDVAVLAAIDFATETTLAAQAADVGLIEGKVATETTLATRATEATLSDADTKLGTIDAVLDSIKDVDGIKKITDQLPAGTNEIGEVAQGTKAADADAWPLKITNESGGAVAEVTEEGRLAVTTASRVPAGATGVRETYQGGVNGSTDNTFTIPSGETLTLTRFVCGGEAYAKNNRSVGTRVELFWDPNGNGSGMTLLAFGYNNGGTYQRTLFEQFTGDGTAAIRVRRESFESTVQITGSWEGYY